MLLLAARRLASMLLIMAVVSFMVIVGLMAMYLDLADPIRL